MLFVVDNQSNFQRMCKVFLIKWFPQLGGLTVHNQHFIVMEREDKTLQSLPFDGFLGMGLKENSNGHLTRAHDPHVLEYITYQPETVIENMVQQGLLSFSVFSFYFTR